MEWLLFRYRVYRVLRSDYNGPDAWRYSAGYKQHMLDGMTPMQAVEWEKTFGIVDGRKQILRQTRTVNPIGAQHEAADAFTKLISI